MLSALKAGVAYFAIVFAIGFALGTIRVLAIAPLIGEMNAVAIELPFMLAISWFACRWIIRVFTVDKALSHRLVMGLCAFALTMIAELGVSMFGFGRSIAEHFETYRHASAMLGLAAQVAFAAFPLLPTRSSTT